MKAVGVFVNASFEDIMRIVEGSRLNSVQLHGRESPDLVYQLRKENLTVIKALYVDGCPSMTAAAQYEASAFLVECSQGVLPGGNAKAWNWEKAKEFGDTFPFILAGGLCPENVTEAVTASIPDAVDVSSGVEFAPGQKDPAKVKSFIDAVAKVSVARRLRNIY
jgi:phosphoribosylanthranilate isomerase